MIPFPEAQTTPSAEGTTEWTAEPVGTKSRLHEVPKSELMYIDPLSPHTMSESPPREPTPSIEMCTAVGRSLQVLPLSTLVSTAPCSPTRTTFPPSRREMSYQRCQKYEGWRYHFCVYVPGMRRARYFPSPQSFSLTPSTVT